MTVIRGIGFAIMFTAIFVVWIWFSTFIGKKLTYRFFYEPSVRETIHKVLHEEGLK